MLRRVLPVLFAGAVTAVAVPAHAQNVVTYSCSDGTELVAAFFRDERAVRVQLDGHALRLPQRLSASGARYAKDGVTLWVKGQGATLKRRGKTVTCAG